MPRKNGTDNKWNQQIDDVSEVSRNEIEETDLNETHVYQRDVVNPDLQERETDATTDNDNRKNIETIGINTLDVNEEYGNVIINKAVENSCIIDGDAETTNDIVIANNNVDDTIDRTVNADESTNGETWDAESPGETVIGNESVVDITVTKVTTSIKTDEPPDDSIATTTSISEDRVVINVAGELFETYAKTLNRYPQTLLGEEKTREKFRNKHGELFFNRSVDAFEAIIYYYQSEGTIYYPELLPLDRFIDEIKFFKLGNHVIEQLEMEQGIKESDEMDLPDMYIFQELWKIVEYPESNTAAKVFAFSSLAVILLSTLLFVLESFPEFSSPTILIRNKTTPVNTTTTDIIIKDENEAVIVKNKHAAWLFSVNTAIIIWFTVEFLLRFITCPDKLQFWTSFGNLVDLFVVLPYYVEQSSGRALGFVRAVRVFRVLKLSRHSAGMQLVGRTIAATYSDLFMAGFLMMILALIYSSVVYFAEYQTPGTVFISIPHAMWWSIVTLTTVGYGDMAPTTTVGKIVSAMTLMSGCLMLSLPLPAVVSNFTYYLNVQKLRNQVQQKKKKVERKKVKRGWMGPFSYFRQVNEFATRLLSLRSQSPPQPPPSSKSPHKAHPMSKSRSPPKPPPALKLPHQAYPSTKPKPAKDQPSPPQLTKTKTITEAYTKGPHVEIATIH